MPERPQLSSDASMERSRRALSKATTFVACTLLDSEKCTVLYSENNPRGCDILRDTRYTVTLWGFSGVKRRIECQSEEPHDTRTRIEMFVMLQDALPSAEG